MKIIINTLISGIVTGSLYAIMTVGLTLAYGVIRLFNFGHGLMAVLGGYFTMLFFTQLGLPLPLAILAACVIMFFAGMVLFKTTLSRLLARHNWENACIFFLIGVGMILENSILQIFGPRIKSIPRFLDGRLKLGLLRINWHDVILIVVVIAAFIAISYLLKKTWMGRSMRAVAQDMDGARIVGINVSKTFMWSFAFATAVTAFSGILLASKFYMTPTVGWKWMFKGFVIVALGGLGSVPGGIIAAFILGLTEAFTTLYFSALWVNPVWFILFLVILLIRPQGLFGGR
jgi:branched-chain amino acid transport system permease protein